MIEQRFAKEYAIYRCRAGSYAYGTQIEGVSDVDERGVFIAPPSHILSVIQSVEQAEDKAKDVVVFELRKFIGLAAANNPNIIDLLFTHPSDILFLHPAFERLIRNRHLFLSKKVRYTFSGFAYKQLQRMKGHKKWIMQPQPEQPPTLVKFCRLIKEDGTVTSDPDEIREVAKTAFLAKTFGKSQFRVFRSPDFFADKLGFFAENETQLKFVNVADNILKERARFVGFLIANIDAYSDEHKTWKQYWEWKANRNPVRAEMEQQFGFDGKHAMHLVRLLKMAKEILTTGEVHVRRPDAQELLAIRYGERQYEEIIAWAEAADAELAELYEKSTLRHSPDLAAIDEIYREIVCEYWRRKGLI